MGIDKIYFSGESIVYHSFHKVLKEVASLMVSYGVPEDKPYLGLMVAWNEVHFKKYILPLLEANCFHIIIIWLHKDKKPWAAYPPTARQRFEDRCTLLRSLNIAELIPKIKVERGQPFDLSNMALCQTIHASNVFDLLKSFSHGGKNDITNRFLAPTRILLQEISDLRQLIQKFAENGWGEEIRNTIHEFNEFVIKEINDDKNNIYGIIGQEIKYAFEAIKEKYDSQSFNDDGSLLNRIEQLMMLLSECRIFSGEQIDESSGRKEGEAPEPIVKVEKQGIPYRILVIDDDAASWRPVLAIVADNIGENVCIEFSVNAETVNLDESGEEIPIQKVMADYDLILLDIYLPGKKGTRILKEFRDCVHGIPVILWTTSVDAELSAEASLANGYLFKKNTSVEQIKNTIASWLHPGQSRRRISLPNPFFDHMIRTSKLRECALEFTNWCLKFMDSFHALDSKYYRFFNDHSGRHLINLLAIIEKLLRPFLFEKSGFVQNYNEKPIPLFSDDSETREQEILALYIAILCHEMGMFSMPGENFDSATKDDLISVRKQHALRSLLILSKDEYKTKEFQGLFKNLRVATGLNAEYIISVIAVLSAYHGRLLSLKVKDFLKIRNANKGKLPDPGSLDNHRHITLVDQKMMQIKGCLKKHNRILVKVNSVDRLRRLCALFRFADAIDVDCTRIPADFLLHHQARSIKDDCENLKRQVVKEISIDRGCVTISFNAPMPKTSKGAFFSKQGIITNQCSDEELLAPWDSKNLFGLGLGAIKDKCNMCDTILEKHFSYADTGSIKQNKTIACAAALAVIGELADEYSSILEISKEPGNKHFNEYIKLKGVYWYGSKDWRKKLTILTKMPKEPGKYKNEIDKLTCDPQGKIVLDAALTDLIGNQGRKFKSIVCLDGDSKKFEIEICDNNISSKYIIVIDKYEDIEKIVNKGEKLFASVGEGLSLLGWDLIKYREHGVLIGKKAAPSLIES